MRSAMCVLATTDRQPANEVVKDTARGDWTTAEDERLESARTAAACEGA